MANYNCIIFGIVACCLIMILPVCAREDQSNMGNPLDYQPSTDVNSIYQNPTHYLDKKITLDGVVTLSFPDEHLFMVSDPVKCGSGCGSKCTVNIIPVSYSGQIPDMKDFVQITGTLVRDKQDKVVFNADIVKTE